MTKIIDRTNGNVVAKYSDKNVAYAPTTECIERLREMGEGTYFIIELKGLTASMAWWDANKYDIAR